MKRMDDFKRTTAAGVRILIFTVVPAMVVFLSMKHAIIQVLFKRGAFDAIATRDSADALFMYTLGIVPASLLLLISRVFFAGQDMKTPLKAGIVMVFLNFFLDIWFAQSWGLGMGFKGIALSTSIVAFINLGILVFILEGRYGGFIRMFLNQHVLKIIIAAFWQYVAAQFFYFVARTRIFDAPMEEPAAFWPVLVSALIGIAISLVIFFALLLIMRAGELRMIKDTLFKRDRDESEKEIRSIDDIYPN
jgi:peptidoglycan biosynthesis protein MviN/MurJ (putative lipid II flippase)